MYKTRFDSQRTILNVGFFLNHILKYFNGMRDHFHFCFWNPSLIPVAEHFKLVKNGVTFETNLKDSNIISGLKTN